MANFASLSSILNGLIDENSYILLIVETALYLITLYKKNLVDGQAHVN